MGEEFLLGYEVRMHKLPKIYSPALPSGGLW
jgi:hypothetical protein